jgi:hypothetical protein
MKKDIQIALFLTFLSNVDFIQYFCAEPYIENKMSFWLLNETTGWSRMTESVGNNEIWQI